MSGSHSEHQPSKPDPKLRHEFVGMMFAITIGEVGLQAAALVQAGHWAHFLPAYSHLVLATVVVATSWVGWSVSAAAREDVRGVFEWEFLVLLLDVSLVITYFILVRTIDFGKESTRPRTDPAPAVARWVFFVFLLYFAWDVLTKVVMGKREGQWLRNHGSRMLPTLVCVVLALVIWWEARTADLPHRLTVDFALLWLVLGFRAGKDFVRKGKDFASACLHKERSWKKFSPMFWILLCLLGMVLGILWTALELPLPLPESIIKEIETEPPKESNRSETSVRLCRRESLGRKVISLDRKYLLIWSPAQHLHGHA